mmetsp:Transcript_43264/g.85694  ORF Transcript_43264/g.85694 Transcript_43264/m.85694 type:complete len:80 (-) Transcript_43264:341-580(-)
MSKEELGHPMPNVTFDNAHIDCKVQRAAPVAMAVDIALVRGLEQELQGTNVLPTYSLVDTMTWVTTAMPAEQGQGEQRN